LASKINGESVAAHSITVGESGTAACSFCRSPSWHVPWHSLRVAENPEGEYGDLRAGCLCLGSGDPFCRTAPPSASLPV